VEPGVLRVPRTAGPVDINGKPWEDTWATAALTGQFPERGGVKPGLPYSEARVAWDDENLYLMLYAADEDVRATPKGHDIPLHGEDSFHVVLTLPTRTVELDVSAAGVLTDALLGADGGSDLSFESGLRFAVDLDGSLNESAGEDDEEWVVEAALPWERLGVKPLRGMRLRVELARCDTPRGSVRRCSAWGEGKGPTDGVVELH
jgi:hypothetical protein